MIRTIIPVIWDIQVNKLTKEEYLLKYFEQLGTDNLSVEEAEKANRNSADIIIEFFNSMGMRPDIRFSFKGYSISFTLTGGSNLVFMLLASEFFGALEPTVLEPLIYAVESGSADLNDNQKKVMKKLMGMEGKSERIDEMKYVVDNFKKMKKALKKIVKKEGLCIYGTPENIHLPEETKQVFRTGTNMAFNECAEIAKKGLEGLNEEITEGNKGQIIGKNKESKTEGGTSQEDDKSGTGNETKKIEANYTTYRKKGKDKK